MAHEIEKLAIALACYKSENDRFPATLGELSPEFLATIPEDVFSGAPLIYRVDDGGYVLYSVGINQRDDGDARESDHDKDDIVARGGTRQPAGAAAGEPASLPSTK